MNAQEKEAWFSLYVTVAALVVYAVLYVITRHPAFSLCAFSILALGALRGRIYRKARLNGEIAYDERDREIGKTAFSIAFGVFWVVFVATVLVVQFVFKPHGSIDQYSTAMGTFVWMAYCLIEIIRTLIIIVLYRKGQHVQQMYP